MSTSSSLYGAPVVTSRRFTDEVAKAMSSIHRAATPNAIDEMRTIATTWHGEIGMLTVMDWSRWSPVPRASRRITISAATAAAPAGDMHARNLSAEP